MKREVSNRDYSHSFSILLNIKIWLSLKLFCACATVQFLSLLKPCSFRASLETGPRDKKRKWGLSTSYKTIHFSWLFYIWKKFFSQSLQCLLHPQPAFLHPCSSRLQHRIGRENKRGEKGKFPFTGSIS